MFVLGPRLILGIRDYNAKLVTDSDAATNMTSIAFQERMPMLTVSSMGDDLWKWTVVWCLQGAGEFGLLFIFSFIAALSYLPLHSGFQGDIDLGKVFVAICIYVSYPISSRNEKWSVSSAFGSGYTEYKCVGYTYQTDEHETKVKKGENPIRNI